MRDQIKKEGPVLVAGRYNFGVFEGFPGRDLAALHREDPGEGDVPALAFGFRFGNFLAGDDDARAFADIFLEFLLAEIDRTLDAFEIGSLACQPFPAPSPGQYFRARQDPNAILGLQRPQRLQVAGLKRVQPFAQHPFVVGHRHLTSPSARPVVHARRNLFAAVPAHIEAQ